jgi:chloramphenicol-sensitive protein RarD
MPWASGALTRRGKIGDGRKGAAAIFAAYVLWGAMPVYWRAMRSIDALEILAHRAVWSCAFTLLLLCFSHRLGGAVSLVRPNRRTVVSLALSGAIITVNWYLYIWAVNSGKILDTSLGYFINPLLSILFGMIFLKERLRRAQWLAIAFAASGVCAELIVIGRLPLLSLGIAFTFALYGLLKKKTDAPPLTGMMIETALITPFALIWLVWQQSAGLADFPYSLSMNLLLVSSGAFTAAPLVVFAWGVSRTSLTVLGVIQYTSPIMTFLTATLVYGEPIQTGRAISFSLIWAGIIVFTVESLIESRRERTARNG